MLRAVLLSLLGAAVLAAVSAVPVDNRNHNEEMVTRCIIEVLSSALSRSSAPPITPECRQVLKNSGKEAKDEEKSDNENTKFEVRLLRDPADVSEAHRTSSREEAGAPGEEDAQGPAKADTEKWTEGGGHSRESTAEPRGSPHPSDSHLSREAKMSEEEEGEDDEKDGRGEDASEGKHPEEPGETQNVFLNKRNQALAKKKEALVARWDTHSAGPSEEKTHSREKGSQESGEETRSQEKHPQKPKSQSQSQEESEESEEDATLEVDKRRTRPRHHHGRSRPDRSQDENLPSREGEQAPERSEEAHVGMAGVGEKRDHHSAHFRASEEEPDYGEEVRSYPGVPAPDAVEGGQHRGRGSEEYRAPRPQSVASREEDKRGQPSLEHRYSEEGEEARGGEQGKGPRHRSKGGELAAYSPKAREEEGFLGEGHHRVQESQMDEARRPSQGDWKEQDRDYPNYGEEGARGKWQQPEDLQDPKVNREEVMLRDKYGPYPSTQKKKRLGGLFNPYFDPLQWKNSRFEKKDSMDDNFLEGEEENGVTLNEKNFFPEYSYDWWERKPFSEDVNWGYKRSFARAPRLDLKRQHDRVAQLDQLLHYRKKSAEFPDFYDSEEQMSPRHEVASERDGDEQRALTEEEEKELENLAAMDLELQKIAETFSQRG